MLRIKIELVPFGKEEWVRELGQIKIINDGSGTQEYGNYTYELAGDIKIKGELKEYNRMQSVFKLLQVVLNKALQ